MSGPTTGCGSGWRLQALHLLAHVLLKLRPAAACLLRQSGGKDATAVVTEALLCQAVVLQHLCPVLLDRQCWAAGNV